MDIQRKIRNSVCSLAKQTERQYTSATDSHSLKTLLLLKHINTDENRFQYLQNVKVKNKNRGLIFPLGQNSFYFPNMSYCQTDAVASHTTVRSS